MQTSRKDYLAMDEVVKPKFIDDTVGYSKRGNPTAAVFDVVDIDRIKPVVDEYGRLHPSASAYRKVMDESVSSDKKRKPAGSTIASSPPCRRRESPVRPAHLVEAAERGGGAIGRPVRR